MNNSKVLQRRRHDPRYSADWWRVGDEERRREQERKQQELAAAEAAKRAFYGQPPAE